MVVKFLDLNNPSWQRRPFAFSNERSGRKVWATVLFLRAIMHKKVIHVNFFVFFCHICRITVLICRNFATMATWQLLNSLMDRTYSLRSRRLEVVGTRKNGRARRRHARGEEAPSPLACLPRARPLSLSPATSKRLLRRLSYVMLFPPAFPPSLTRRILF